MNNNKLTQVQRTLHDLLKALPAVRANCSREVLQRHLQLIAHFRARYERLALSAAPA